MAECEELIRKFQGLVGREIDRGDWLEIDQERIDAFARVTQDEQWIHTDPVRAGNESPYGSTIAHGFLTLSLLPYLSGGNAPEEFAQLYPGMRLRVNYGLNKVRFPAPVKCGESIRARTAVASVEAVKGGVQIIMSLTVDIDGSDKPACVAEQVFRLYP